MHLPSTRSRRASAVVALVAVLLCISCSSRALMRVEQLGEVAAKGDYLKGIKEIRASEKLYGNLNRFLFFFDQGVLFHYAGEYDSSLVYLEESEKVLDELYARSVTNEAVAILTNDNLRPYRSHRYEQVLLHQFMSFDYLAKGQLDESLVESRKVQLVFDAFADKDGAKAKYNDDGMSHFMTSIVYGAEHQPDDELIALYKSVDAYQNGPVPLPQLVKDIAYYSLMGGGRENDAQTLKITPSDPAEKVVGLDPKQSEIILVGYAGKGPTLDEMVMWGDYVADGMIVLHYRNPATNEELTMALPAPPIPDVEAEKRGENGKKAPVKSGTTFFVKFAVPVSVQRPSQASYFTVRTGEGPETRSASFSNTDQLLDKDLEDTRSRTIARTVVRVVLRTIAMQKAKSEVRTSSPMANLLINVGADVASGQMEKADTRLCFLLPKTFQIARIAVEPGTHRVSAAAKNAQGAVVDQRAWDAVNVKQGEKKFLFYPVLQ